MKADAENLRYICTCGSFILWITSLSKMEKMKYEVLQN